MPFTLTMPKLSPTMNDGMIVRWHKKEGDFVEAGDLLVEISTDKATIEYNALDPGYLRKIVAEEGKVIPVNEPLAIFTRVQNESIEAYKPEGVTPPAPPREKEEAKPTAPPQRAKDMHPSRLIASPLARHIAKEEGIDLEKIKGSGPRGRIMSRDLAGIKEEEKAPISAEKEEALTPLRRIIAERMAYSKATIPHFYLLQEVQVDSLVELKEESKKSGDNFTINDFILKACGVALSCHPDINVGFNTDQNKLIRFSSVDIACAVTIPGGLITPVITNADKKPLAEISSEIKALALRAKEGKLKKEEYEGGSFTVSNLGMFGVTVFQAIINPPQGAILSIGSITDRAVVKAGVVTPAKVIMLGLSCDHRAIDGAEGARFLATLKGYLENPVTFLAR
jgi:pyruvate dehydrogenase E2 component (dihydrolipoamide acetyltransferase)